MIRLARAPSLLLAQHWVNLLAQARIPCELHNQYLQGALGEIPVDQCGPEVWIEHERDLEAARALIHEGAPAGALPWHCAGCGERLEPQFTVCWQCGAARPA